VVTIAQIFFKGTLKEKFWFLGRGFGFFSFFDGILGSKIKILKSKKYY